VSSSSCRSSCLRGCRSFRVEIRRNSSLGTHPVKRWLNALGPQSSKVQKYPIVSSSDITKPGRSFISIIQVSVGLRQSTVVAEQDSWV
jgi:hypothetical protein